MASASGKKTIDEPLPVKAAPPVIGLDAGPVAHGDTERVARVLHELAQLTDPGSLGTVVQAALGRYRRAVAE